MAEAPQAPARVALTVSAFRSDTSVISLLRSVFTQEAVRFHRVIVVDSLGSGAIQREIDANHWPVEYVNAQENLGSAGNLAMRMDRAAASGADWCYCLNHDGNLDTQSVLAMMELGQCDGRIGAVYPLLHHGDREDPWEAGRQTFFPSAAQRFAQRPSCDLDVLWSSSNGALYNLAPYRTGIRVWRELWMGYEDLGYGMLLHANGWRQVACCRAELRNIFDYKARRVLHRELHIPDKPVWYCYYNLRNLILIQKRLPSAPGMMVRTGAKALKETVKILLLEDSKAGRLYLLWAGALHGLQGKTGKGRYP